jgi:hypothetical protein
MVDMNVFLAEENGVKLATKVAFWKNPEVMVVHPKMIWPHMRAHGWTAKEIKAARTARHDATPERKAARAAHYVKNREEILAQQAAHDATPERKAQRAAYNASPERKAQRAAYNASPEGKAQNAAYNASPERKAAVAARKRERYANDPQFRMTCLLRDWFTRILNAIKENNLSLDPKQIKSDMKLDGKYDVNAYYDALEKTLPPGVAMDDWRSGAVDLHVDHVVSLDFAVKHDHKFPGLLKYANSPANVMFLDKTINSSKHDKIILELIPQNCPGYPFTGIDAEVFTTIEEAGLPRAPFEKWLEIKKILETL